MGVSHVKINIIPIKDRIISIDLLIKEERKKLKGSGRISIIGIFPKETKRVLFAPKLPKSGTKRNLIPNLSATDVAEIISSGKIHNSSNSWSSVSKSFKLSNW